MDKKGISIFTSLLLAASTLTFASLSGCFLAPTYHRPTVGAAPSYKEEPSTTTAISPFVPAHPADAQPRGNWWEIFGDPQLNALEEKVAVSNQNVKLAEAQYREAHAVVTVNSSNYFPTFTTTPSATRLQTSANNFHGNGVANGATYNQFELPVQGSWEPDFWGQVTMEVRGAKASAQASAAALQGMRLSMQGELAADYFSLAAVDVEEKLLLSTMQDYKQSLVLTQARYTGGVASQADVALAETQLQSAAAQATDLGISRAQFEHAIAVLVGQSPSTFSLPALEIKSPPPMIPVGVPSELLERRPDVASAERAVVSANEEIGVAHTAFFPQISLTAVGGYESANVSNWITLPSRVWSIGAEATQTLLDFGRTIGLAKEARANYDAAVANYRQTVLAAFQEVEDNLAAERLLAQEATQQADAVKSAQQSLQLEELRYTAGIVSQIDLIAVQNSTYQNENTAVQVLGRQMNAAVALIRATGGGWDDSQLPWPKMMPSHPDDKNTPLSPTATPNTVVVSTVAVSALIAPTTVPAGILLSTTTAPSISSGTAVVVPSTAIPPVPVVSTTTPSTNVNNNVRP